MKAIAALADAPGDVLETTVRKWHDLAVRKGVIGTEPFEETWIDFLKSWPKVRFPKGDNPMREVFDRVKRQPLSQTKYATGASWPARQAVLPPISFAVDTHCRC